jgi:hypothetical protein
VAAGFVATAIIAAIVIIIRDKNGDKVAEVNLASGVSADIRYEANKDDKAVAQKPTVDDAWLKQIAALPAEKQVEAVFAKMKALNPGFDGKETHSTDSVVRQLNFAVNNVTDISPLRALTGLQELTCNGSGEHAQFSDLSPLKGMKLTRLSCQNTQVSDLSPLKDMPLTLLICEATQVSDLTPLKGMSHLWHLNCGGTRVCDLSPLKGIPLTDLVCWRTQVSDLSPLKEMKLTRLECLHTQVSDLTPLKGMPLTFLSCEPSQVSDLTPLKGMPLIYLCCCSTRVSDLSVLKELPLKGIWCDFVPERDAKILRSIKTLEKINDKPAAEFWKDVDAKKA